MKKVACAVLILTLTIFLVNPLSSDARGGHWGWWAPWAVIGGAAVLAAPYYYAPYYSPYYASPTVIIREQPPVYFQPAPSVTPPSTERILSIPGRARAKSYRRRIVTNAIAGL